MISDKVLVADKGNECDGLEKALELVEKTAEYNGFGPQDTATLRTLAQEMVIGCASVLNVFSGTMWVETEESNFDIKLEMEGVFSQMERERLIEMTRDNKNTLPKGFFAKLGALLGDTLSGEYFYPYGIEMEPADAEIMWTNAELAEMLAEADRQDPEDKALEKEAKEKIDTLADDIKVTASANRVLIVVTKALPKA